MVMGDKKEEVHVAHASHVSSIVEDESPRVTLISKTSTDRHRIYENYFKKSLSNSSGSDDESKSGHFSAVSPHDHPLSLSISKIRPKEPISERSVQPQVTLGDDFPYMEPILDASEELNEQIRSIFGLPETEHLVEEFMCAYYQSNFPNQGKMYICENFVCFSSNIFGYKIELVIPYSDIKALEKKMTALFVPNAIQITTHDNVAHFFGSFVFRDQTFAIIYELWQLHLKNKDKTEQEMLKTQNSNSEESSISDTERQDSVDSSSISSNDENDGTKDEYDSEETTESINVAIVEASKDNVSDNNHDSSQHSRDRRGQENDESQEEGNDNDENESVDKNKDQPDDNDEKDLDEKVNGDVKSDNIQNDDEQEEEDKYIVNDITDISQIPPTAVFVGSDKYKQKEVFRETLPAKASDVFWVLFADNCNLELEHHISRGDKDLSITPWQQAPDGEIGMVREMKFVSLVNNSLGPKTTHVLMLQRMVIFKDRSCYFVQNNLHSLDVMYGDTFRIQCNLIVTDNGDGSSQLVVTTGVVFLKSPRLLRWKIEEVASKESADSYNMWARQAKQAVIDAKEKGILRSQTRKCSEKRRDVDKKRKKTHHNKKKPAPIKASQETSTHIPITATTKIVTRTPFDTISTANFDSETNIFMRLLGHVITFISHAFDKVNVPVWCLLLFALIFFAYIIPQQRAIVQTLQKVDKDLQYYKSQNAIFENHLNYALFNLTQDGIIPPDEIQRRRSELRKGITNWLNERTKIYGKYDASLLGDVLSQVNEMKRKTAPAPQSVTEMLLQQDAIQRQQQQRQLDIITWSIVGLVVLTALKMVLSLFGVK